MLDQDGLIDRIYEAAVVPELWPRVLHDISVLSGCLGGVLFTTAAREITRWTSSDGTRSLFEEFLANQAAQDDNIRLKKSVAARHHGFLGNHQLYGRAEMDQSAIYTDFFFPRGLGYMTGTVLPMPNGDIAVFDLERRFSDGPVSTEEVARLDVLRPHLARAAALSTRLNLERARAIVDALGQAGMPAAVLGNADRVLAANPAIQALSRQIVFLAHSKIGLCDASSSQLLTTALATLSQQGSTSSIPLPSTEGAVAGVLHVLPLPGTAREIFSGAKALLIVTQLDRPASPTAELLTGLFDLTASEAKVARGVSEGRSVDEIATALGLSRETVRFYLKGVFAKTGVSRQVDLAALLSGATLANAG